MLRKPGGKSTRRRSCFSLADWLSLRNVSYLTGLTHALTNILSNASEFTLGNLQALRKSYYLKHTKSQGTQ